MLGEKPTFIANMNTVMFAHLVTLISREFEIIALVIFNAFYNVWHNILLNKLAWY